MAVTNVQNEDNTQQQNMSAMEETETYYQTIAREYDEGLITDESIREACEAKGVDPAAILEYVHMTNLEREMSPYYKTDLSDVPVEGTDYNGTLEDGETVTVAGCTITATKYTGDEVADTDDVFGLEVLKAQKYREKDGDKTTMDYVGEWAFGWTGIYKGDKNKVSEDEYMPDERVLYHCSSPYLGEFDYDPTIYQIGYKEVVEADGSISQLPVLQYINDGLISNVDDVPYEDGTTNFQGKKQNVLQEHLDLSEDIHDNLIPDGCRVIDYTFMNGNGTHGINLQYVPKIPEGVVSAHCAFMGCDDLEIMPDYDSDDYANGNVNATRDCLLPSTLENTSNMFKGCSSLNGTFHSRKLRELTPEMQARLDEMNLDEMKPGAMFVLYETVDTLPYGVVNTIDMFSGCDGLDQIETDGFVSEVYFGPKTWTVNNNQHSVTFDKAKFGGNYTPYLAPDMMRGIYDDIADSSAAARREDDTSYFKDDDRESVINDDGTINYDLLSQGSHGNLDEDKMNQSQSAQIILDNGKVDSGHVDTSVEVSSDGQRTNNKIKDDDGNYIYDDTGKKVSIQDYVGSSAAWWEKAAMMTVAGGVLSGVGGALTGNKWAALGIGIGGTVLLDKVAHVFPESLYPVVDWTAGILPSPAKEKVRAWAEENIPGAENYILNQEIAEKNEQIRQQNAQWDNDYNLGKENYSARMTEAFGNATRHASDSLLADKDVTLYMKENAKGMVEELSFAGMAMCGEDSASCVYDTIDGTVSIAAESFQSRFAGKTLTEAEKAEVFDYYKTVMESLEAFSTSAVENIEFMDGSVPEKAALQMDGLGMCNRAYTSATIESLKALDSELHFMDDAKWAEIESMDVTGVNIENIRNYDATYFDALKFDAAGRTVQDIKSLASVDDDFKASMGDDLSNIDERIPEGWVDTTPPEETVENTDDTNSSLRDAFNAGNESAEATTEDEVQTRSPEEMKSLLQKPSRGYENIVDEAESSSNEESADYN